MLVLTRKLQEKITIAGNITVTVLRVKGQTVRIGIEAPREIRVVRGELPPEEAAAGEAAADDSEDDVAAEAAGEENPALNRVAGSTKQISQSCSDSRLPQRRKFDRYSQPPLKRALSSAVALAK